MTLRTVNVFGRSSGCHHSGRPESWLIHLPGLVVLAPSWPADTKAMLKFAIRSDDPVVFIENAMLYGESGPRGEADELVPFGSASVVREGSDITVLSYSGSVRRALAAAQALEARGISLEVIDLRSLAPLDTDTIMASVAKTRRVIAVSEDVRTAGVGAELCALVTEQVFSDLLAPPARISAANTPVPFSPVLEEAIAPTVAKLVGTAIRQMSARRPAAAHV